MLTFIDGIAFPPNQEKLGSSAELQKLDVAALFEQVKAVK